jgi:hypothetical protein
MKARGVLPITRSIYGLGAMTSMMPIPWIALPNGTWNASSETNKFTYNSGTDTPYTMTFVPQTFYARTGIGRIGFLIKAKDGAGDKKSQDIYKEVGAFSVTMINPDTNNGTPIC